MITLALSFICFYWAWRLFVLAIKEYETPLPAAHGVPARGRLRASREGEFKEAL